MMKKILILVLVAAILSLASCRVVEVIDHGTTAPEETTAPPKEYSPWGFWHSYSTSGAIELVEGSDKAKLYSLADGYYEYETVEEVSCTYDGNAIFTLSTEDESLSLTFDKFANTLTLNTTVFVPAANAPEEHPEYPFPDYTQFTPTDHVTLGDIDYPSLSTSILEGAPYDIALEFYGGIEKIPVLEEPSRPAQSGDCVNIDYRGKLDGVAFTGGTATDVDLFISDYKNEYIPGFTDGIIGRSVGETFNVNVTFPENYHASDLAGKEVVFTMTLNSIYNLSLTDEEVAEYKDNDYKTYAEWLDIQKIEVAKSLIYDAVLETSKTTDLPKESYLYFYQHTLDYYHLMAYYYNLTFDQLKYYLGVTETAILQQALHQTTYNLALYILADQNELAWTEEDYTTKYEEYVADYLKTYPEETREQACEYADKHITQMKHQLTEETVIKWAMEQIFPTVTE